MARKQMSHRRATCKSKLRYPYEGLAAEAAVRLEEDENGGHPHRWPITHYECSYCGGWHVGHVPFSVLTKIRTPHEIDLIFKHNPRHNRITVRPCEVIVCGKSGPHQCQQTGTKMRNSDRFVCNHHMKEAAAYRVFTEAEAIALHRARRRKEEERRNANRVE